MAVADVIILRDFARHYRDNLEVEAFGFALPLTKNTKLAKSRPFTELNLSSKCRLSDFSTLLVHLPTH